MVRRQKPEDQLMNLMRALYGSSAGSEIPEKELQVAAERVGLTDEKRISWAIKFAEEPFEKMSVGDRINTQIEMGAFLYPSLPFAEKEGPKSIPFVAALFPSREQIEEIKRQFLVLIQHAAAGSEHSFNVAQMSVNVGPGAVSYQIPQNLSDPEKLAIAQIDVAKLDLAKLLAAHWGYVGRCDRKRHGCGRYFLKSRTDREFCSKTCLNRSTTYRQRGKEPAA